MTAVFTPSLFDSVPDGSLGALPTGPGDVSWTGAHRTRLDDRSWIDVVPGWLPGADGWFDELVGDVAWNQRHRRMFTQEIVEPRLTSGWALGEAPSPSEHLAAALTEHYRRAVRPGVGELLPRRGGLGGLARRSRAVRASRSRSSRSSRSARPRRFGLRALAGGGTRWLTLCGGDLLVMGGRCQHEWQHTVPKEPGAGPADQHDVPPRRPRPDRRADRTGARDSRWALR